MIKLNICKSFFPKELIFKLRQLVAVSNNNTGMQRINSTMESDQ